VWDEESGERKKEDFPRILTETLADWSDGFQNVIVVDCRTWCEYAGGHIGGALNVPADEGLGCADFCDATFNPDQMCVLYSEYGDSNSCAVVSYRQFMGQHWSHRDRHDALLHAYVLDGGCGAFVEAVPGEWGYGADGAVS
jgi:3-mercaptopyruvate sulfurtransferase SseA